MTNSLGLITRIDGQLFTQFGIEILLTQMPFKQLESVFAIDHKVQRELNISKRNQIRQYIMDYIEEGFDFSPFIFSARGAIELEDESLSIAAGKQLMVLDGQHRFYALRSAVKRLEQKQEALLESGKAGDKEFEDTADLLSHLYGFPITLQIYLDLTPAQERQLFTDINTARREAHQGLVMQYDHRDGYVQLTQTIAKELEDEIDIEWEVSRLTQSNTSLSSLTIIKRCLIAMFEGRVTGNKWTDPDPKFCSRQDMESIGMEFFKSLKEIFPDKAWDRNAYTSGLAGIQIALAYAVYSYVESKDCGYREAIKRLMKVKGCCTWRHDDQLYKEFYERKSKRIRRHSDFKTIRVISEKFMGCM